MATKDLEPGMLAAPNVRLEEKLAEGGMGSVWIAQHLTLKTRVAVKFMLAELGNTAEVVERFEREARAVATIKSPHVVQVLDHGVSEAGHPFIVMELLEGEDLAQRIDRDKNLSLPLTAQIILQASKALGKAHQLGIVHRDLKPENLFLTDVEGDVFVKVLDFGIAKRTEEKSKRMTVTGSMLGTPIFMSPEQMTNAKAVGPASDQWALGVVTYYALTGVLPFDGETMAALAIAVDRGVYVPATERVTGLDPAIDDWFKRVLQKDPGDRFPSVKEMADSLHRIAEGASDSPGSRVPLSSSPESAAPALSGTERADMRTIAGTTTESGGGASSRVLGLAALAVLLVGVAVAGIVLMQTSPKDSGKSGSSTVAPTDSPLDHSQPAPKATSAGPVITPVEPPQLSATAQASASASPSAAPKSVSSGRAPIRPLPHASATPGSEIPTTF